MKTTISALLIVALLLCSICMFAACKSESSVEDLSETLETSAAPITGGWTIPDEPEQAVLSEEQATAFELATAELTGASYTPLACIGTQVVAGCNYAYLCKTTLVTDPPASKLCVVKVYQDLEGNASILDVVDINVEDYTENSEIDFTADNLAGGWMPTTEAGKLPEEVQTAFDKATEELTGVGYTPLCLMGSQVVAGANYAILCTATQVTAEPASALAVVTVYADLEGGAEITSIAGFTVE